MKFLVAFVLALILVPVVASAQAKAQADRYLRGISIRSVALHGPSGQESAVAFSESALEEHFREVGANLCDVGYKVTGTAEYQGLVGNQADGLELVVAFQTAAGLKKYSAAVSVNPSGVIGKSDTNFLMLLALNRLEYKLKRQVNAGRR